MAKTTKPNYGRRKGLGDQQRIELDELLDIESIKMQTNNPRKIFTPKAQKPDWKKHPVQRFASTSRFVMEASGKLHQLTQSNATTPPTLKRRR